MLNVHKKFTDIEYKPKEWAESMLKFVMNQENYNITKSKNYAARNVVVL